MNQYGAGLNLVNVGSSPTVTDWWRRGGHLAKITSVLQKLLLSKWERPSLLIGELTT